MDMGATVVALSILKIATMLGISTGIISGVKYFNTFELKTKKKGSNSHESDEIKSLRERIGSRS
ncbi:hypothetical protein [Metabacillus sp. Hm71]|uniref:hypothetical protein n=1 Tax=Metabacillus sp. Hm71 TaxID=3450743 RepID=UPI003F42182F